MAEESSNFEGFSFNDKARALENKIIAMLKAKDGDPLFYGELSGSSAKIVAKLDSFNNMDAASLRRVDALLRLCAKVNENYKKASLPDAIDLADYCEEYEQIVAQCYLECKKCVQCYCMRLVNAYTEESQLDLNAENALFSTVSAWDQEKHRKAYRYIDDCYKLNERGRSICKVEKMLIAYIELIKAEIENLDLEHDGRVHGVGLIRMRDDYRVTLASISQASIINGIMRIIPAKLL